MMQQAVQYLSRRLTQSIKYQGFQ